MRKPQSPPAFAALFVTHGGAIQDILAHRPAPTVDGKYLHWDELRHRTPPVGLGHEQWWFGIKLTREASRTFLPFHDRHGRPFSLTMTPQILEALHDIDSLGTGRIAMPEPVTSEATRDRFLFQSLVEEAITSSQLEGAATTRRRALDMIRSGRSPTDKSERMIFNNYVGMELIRAHKNDPLTPTLVLDIHRRMTEGTLPEASSGQVQSPRDVRVHVGSNTTGEVLHEPPPAEMLPERMQAMCDFANKVGETEFLHPALRAIVLHLWLAYDHPFEDGNGRTARALFYWSMLHQRYWLFEFISISAILKQASAQYGRSFLYTETDDNDATYFVVFQLRVIRRALAALEQYLEKKTRQIQEAESALKEMGVFNHRQLALLSHALRHHDAEYTVRSHQNSHQVVYATARSDLLDLVERGLLTQRKLGNAMHFFPSLRLLERER